MQARAGQGPTVTCECTAPRRCRPGRGRVGNRSRKSLVYLEFKLHLGCVSAHMRVCPCV